MTPNKEAKRRYKIVMYVPEENASALRKAIAEAGAGIIGNYDHCTFTIKGIGRFRPNEKANPAIGSAGRIEEVNEDRIETVCEPDKLEAVLAAIRATHPYEEPATDVYPIEVFE